MMNPRILANIAIVSTLIAFPALAGNVAQQNPDNSTVAVSGTIAKADAQDSFVLDYGTGTVRVEMDDWYKVNEPAQVLEGDKVRVYGRVDRDIEETATIEAKSVYLENLGVKFEQSASDEESMVGVDLASTQSVTVGDVAITGRVESIDDRLFTLNDGHGAFTVDTSRMDYNPLKKPGLRDRAVTVGDRVTVQGTVSSDLFELGKMHADSIVIRVNSRYGIDQPWDGPNPRAPATQPKPVL